ncbi:unnamed protein product, partial [Effrenium voratum]
DACGLPGLGGGGLEHRLRLRGRRCENRGPRGPRADDRLAWEPGVAALRPFGRRLAPH